MSAEYSNDNNTNGLRQYSTEIKIEQTAKGARVTIHIFGKTDDDTRIKAIKLYQQIRKDLQDQQVELAPIESKGGW